MAAQRGKDLLIKLDAQGSGDFETIAGLRATRLSLNAAAVDATSAEASGRWRELLAGAGVQSASVSGSGVFKDAASDAALRTVFFDGATPPFQLVIPDFGRIEGAFLVSRLEYAGDHDAEALFTVSLESAGPLVFTAF
ncbi:phage major tail protein, TP901-1 family [Rubrimonas cliftonensis]|uniref:Phage major tail protein, TP901-1 family n=1 Tax=Rubrimonas cliftonensis TaxID=89524 RepID=A0A1H3ZHB4_9RHOB|nr:phage major tail protein, TP901-1 family [Rubrimonas cliftonensis]SEA23045.1 phage major tail protein, TP901-1 family [Rubrimonas cliftonensis]